MKFRVVTTEKPHSESLPGGEGRLVFLSTLDLLVCFPA